MGVHARIAVRDVDKGYKKIKKLVDQYAARDSYVKVGFLDAGKGAEKRGELTNAEIAARMEYGSEDGTQPPRPAVVPTFDQQRGALVVLAEKLIGGILDGVMTVERALGIMGATLAAEIKKKITTGPEIPPPNAPSTARKKKKLTRKGATMGIRTWIDTGRLIASLTWAVIIERRK
jgi:hypothetical protein